MRLQEFLCLAEFLHHVSALVMKCKGSILTIWLIKIFWILNGSYLYRTKSNKSGVIRVILVKKLEKDVTVQTLINIKKIKFFLGSSSCYFFLLAIFGLSLDCKWERGIKSSISNDRTMPLFILGICYLKNMQAISVSKESCSKWANSWRPEKNLKTVLQVKTTSSLESLSHPTALLWLWTSYPD